MPTMTTGQSWVRPELAAHLEEQVLDVVADAAGAVGAEVREVLADLGGVDPGQLGQSLRRDRGRGPVELEQAAQVHRQPGDRGLGDALDRAPRG